jgi:hypothetical protein
MRRRDFIANLGGAAIMPHAGRAQERVCRIGVLVPASADDLVINMKAAKTLGLTVPPALIARADEVIE